MHSPFEMLEADASSSSNFTVSVHSRSLSVLSNIFTVVLSESNEDSPGSSTALSLCPLIIAPLMTPSPLVAPVLTPSPHSSDSLCYSESVENVNQIGTSSPWRSSTAASSRLCSPFSPQFDSYLQPSAHPSQEPPQTDEPFSALFSHLQGPSAEDPPPTPEPENVDSGTTKDVDEDSEWTLVHPLTGLEGTEVSDVAEDPSWVSVERPESSLLELEGPESGCRPRSVWSLLRVSPLTKSGWSFVGVFSGSNL
uniref:Uncharacterized protein n=1 Tax=Chromera velia CCMP2878 TaxID=1169474 RepID=A0A0G4HT63_9ALVE|eukprot:Cvel_31318.t1-p1 / transcript=Cvel_31318.t1 / gene=Cvel_31318 / organism=Chromera_velia_CCMP2878 / gene_product=hypothetical protein / transcript_product=hypothetical protein / location=Cvel_scaffold4647:4956-5708(+) / protein_length=251 / sequence_SO=supercontig / SO=protein_coding / is_pseudo=false